MGKLIVQIVKKLNPLETNMENNIVQNIKMDILVKIYLTNVVVIGIQIINVV